MNPDADNTKIADASVTHTTFPSIASSLNVYNISSRYVDFYKFFMALTRNRNDGNGSFMTLSATRELRACGPDNIEEITAVLQYYEIRAPMTGFLSMTVMILLQMKTEALSSGSQKMPVRNTQRAIMLLWKLWHPV